MTTDPERPDDAMDTGSDAGAPGDHLPEPPLATDERATLEDLLDGAQGEAQPAVEDSPAAVAAADDDAPLPGLGTGGDEDDPDTPAFRAAD
jgi:hypothetical protein